MRPLRVLGLAEGEQGAVGQNAGVRGRRPPANSSPFRATTGCGPAPAAISSVSANWRSRLESQLRPKEIQARIRAGATVEQVASIAGTSASRVERFAYPVLLERASVAERAIKARPAIDGITAGVSVAETVAATLSARGHDGDVKWDAFKDDEGWVLALTWNAGRSENRAHWLFHPGPDGGTLSARDEAAAEIVDPALRILRPLRPVGVSSAVFDPGLPAPTVSDPAALEPRLEPRRATERPVKNGEPSRSAHPAGSRLPSAAPTAPVARPGGPTRDRPTTRGSRFGAPLQPQNLTPQGSATPNAGVAAPVGWLDRARRERRTHRRGHHHRRTHRGQPGDGSSPAGQNGHRVVGTVDTRVTGRDSPSIRFPAPGPVPRRPAPLPKPPDRHRPSRPGAVNDRPCRPGRTCCWARSPPVADRRM